MHELEASDRQLGADRLDVLARLPPPGVWVLLHGALAAAALRLLAGTSRPVAAGEAPELPEAFPRPLSAEVARYAWNGGRAWIIRPDRNGDGPDAYVSCYVYGLR